METRNKYQDNPLMTVALLISFFGMASLAYPNWGTDMVRAFVAVLMMFWCVGVGYFIRDGV